MIDLNKNSFHFLRFFLAMIVFLGHLGTLSAVKELSFLSHAPFELAVKSFFIISGFLIAKSYERSSSLKNYFLKRIKRIVPAYLVVVFLSAFLLVFMSSLSFHDYFTHKQFYKYLFWNSIYLNFMAPYLPEVFENNTVNGALWTIKIEECFYLIIPVIFLLLNKYKKYALLSLISIYILSLIYKNYFELIGMEEISRQIFGAMCYFVSGMILYFNLEFFLKYKYYFLFIALPFYGVDYFFSQLTIFSPFILGIIIVFLAFSLPFLDNFGKYGDFTYGIYIFHFPIIQICKFSNLFELYNPFLVGFLIFIVVIIVGILSWHLIEKRIIGYKKTDTKSLKLDVVVT